MEREVDDCEGVRCRARFYPVGVGGTSVSVFKTHPWAIPDELQRCTVQRVCLEGERFEQEWDEKTLEMPVCQSEI